MLIGEQGIRDTVRDGDDKEEERGEVKMGCLCIRCTRQEKQDHIFRPGGTPPPPELYLQGHQHIFQNTFISPNVPIKHFGIETI